MKFNYDAYEKCFPKTAATPEIDSAVDGYTPTADEAKGDKSTEAAVETANDDASNGLGAQPAQPEGAQPATPPQEDISQNQT